MVLNVLGQNSIDFILAVIGLYIKDTKGLARSFLSRHLKKKKNLCGIAVVPGSKRSDSDCYQQEHLRHLWVTWSDSTITIVKTIIKMALLRTDGRIWAKCPSCSLRKCIRLMTGFNLINADDWSQNCCLVSIGLEVRLYFLTMLNTAVSEVSNLVKSMLYYCCVSFFGTINWFFSSKS